MLLLLVCVQNIFCKVYWFKVRPGLLRCARNDESGVITSSPPSLRAQRSNPVLRRLTNRGPGIALLESHDFAVERV
ncbi:MAG: hypothetical protein WCG04_01915 [Alphaproteobacteria bacterium]